MQSESRAPEGTGKTNTSRRFALIALWLVMLAAGWYKLVGAVTHGPQRLSFPALVLATLAVTLGVAGLSGERPDRGGRPISIASIVLGVSVLVHLLVLRFDVSIEWYDRTSVALAGLGVVLGVLGNRRTENRWILSLIPSAAVLIALGSVPGLADLVSAWPPLLLGLAAIALGILGLRSRGARGIAVLALVLGLLLVVFLVALTITFANCC